MPHRTIHPLPNGTADDMFMHTLAEIEGEGTAREARLKAMLDEGLADIRAGRTVPAEEVFRELDAIIASKARTFAGSFEATI